MTVSASDRAAWTARGAQDAAQRTYASVRTALERSPRLAPYNYEVFLQGSYANATNLRGDSDVDIVVMLRSTYIPNVDQLSSSERQLYDANRIPGTFKLADFRSDMHAALDAYYGNGRVHGKDKCIRVDRRDGYVDADVVPAYQHRLYTAYTGHRTAYIEGIEIRPRSGGSIVNFPKEHIRNGEEKNGRCITRYKPTVRQVKRLANHAASMGKFEKGALPGYVLECMAYNVGDDRFVSNDSDRLLKVMVSLHIQNAEDYRRMKSCDEVHRLFVDDPGKHNEYLAKRVIDEMWGVL